ncbi:hypothetical protein [Bacillus wiedmannii]|uniref:hypothetical protein n=1 Tax=Bacillus wiedmannii TaxID=1890302 RepID=UPI003D96139A
MNKENYNYAEKVLKHLFVGAQIDRIQFDITSDTIKIHFINFEIPVDYDNQLYVNIESKWSLFNSPPARYPSNEDEFDDYSEEDYKRIYEMRRQKVIDIKLDKESPHLLITFENNKTMFVNGFHDCFECWQAGVQRDDWLVVAAPGNAIATWAPDDFINA